MDPGHIDSLLERYLHLLHEYTTLRANLGALHAAMYQNLARANFSAERGVRYGPDFYDNRMQALRRLEVTSTEDGGLPNFSVVGWASNPVEGKGDEELEDASGSESESVEDSGSDIAAATAEKGEEEEDGEEREREKSQPAREKNRDPLRWFGMVTPTSLKFAQGQAIQIVEDVIPRLATVQAEMQDVEIEVRRARKRRAKAQAQAAKGDTQSSGPPTSVSLGAA